MNQGYMRNSFFERRVAPCPFSVRCADRKYLLRDGWRINPGFVVTAVDILEAVKDVNRAFEGYPEDSFLDMDTRDWSSRIGSIFNRMLSSRAGAFKNPNIGGHPDILPIEAQALPVDSLKNYSQGIEVKVTIGSLTKNGPCGPGYPRLEHTNGVTWTAHHKEVAALMALGADFIGKRIKEWYSSVITSVFYSESDRDDWGVVMSLV
jgi:hypothetical protein